MRKKEAIAQVNIAHQRPDGIDGAEIGIWVEITTHACTAIHKPSVRVAKKLEMAATGSALVAIKRHGICSGRPLPLLFEATLFLKCYEFRRSCVCLAG